MITVATVTCGTFMLEFIIENSKLIMVFLLIATVIGLSSFGNRPYQGENLD